MNLYLKGKNKKQYKWMPINVKCFTFYGLNIV